MVVRFVLSVLLATSCLWCARADDVSVSLPPSTYTDLTRTSGTGAVAKASVAIPSGKDDVWYSVRLNKFQPYTLWTTNVVPSGGISSLTVHSRTKGAADMFTVTTDDDGTLRATLTVAAWSGFSDVSAEFFFRIKGEPSATCGIYYQKAVVPEIKIGTKERPYLFDFFHTDVAPEKWYDSVTKTTLTNGYYYLASDLTAGERYYFGVSSNTASSLLFAVNDPDGETVRLDSLSGYWPWSSEITNIVDDVRYLTNREERISVYTRYTTISNSQETVTNELVVAGVYTNSVDGIEALYTNFCAVVTNVDYTTAGAQTIVETITNYQSLVTSIQTNFVTLTNVSHAGICREAYRFVPPESGRYSFVFKGTGSFTLYHAVMDAIPDGDDLEFSSPDGTSIPASGKLKLKINCLRSLPSTNVLYTVDGSDPRFHGVRYVSALQITCPTVVRACLTLDDGSWGNVYSAHYYPAAGDIAEALDVPANVVLGADAVDWFEDIETTDDGARTVRNKALVDNESATLTAVVSGEGAFSFRWRTSSEEMWDEAVLYTNGVEMLRLSGETAWDEPVVVPVQGMVELVWSFSRDDEGEYGDNCVWLSSFAFVPSAVMIGGVSVSLDWFAEYGLSDVADALLDGKTYAVAVAQMSLPRSLYDSYVAGLDPTNAAASFTASVAFTNGVPVVEWNPNLEGDRVYTVEGKKNLDDAKWSTVTNGHEAEFNFFRVSVGMP